jgi:hypothetical protein
MTPPRPSRALASAGALRIARAARPLTDRWREEPVASRGPTLLGISFRPRQAEALGLDPEATLRTLLAYPFDLVRLGAYWDRVEPAPGRFVPDALDWELDAAERAGKRIILCVGAVKTFGYPECFVPAHHLATPLREGALVTPDSHPALLAASVAFVTRVVERYRERSSIVAWQVEHEAADPLGVEHSWRLAEAFARAEVDAVRAVDPTRPIMMNGFLPTSLPVAAQQRWRTRDQGDSLAVARRLADMVGIGYYPRHALLRAGPRTLYLNGGLRGRRAEGLRAWAAASGRGLMIAEGQAEPWEPATTPPSPAAGAAMYSCPPERVIQNYTACVEWARLGGAPLYAYLFWGAEYWVLRERDGDPTYLQSFARVLDEP